MLYDIILPLAIDGVFTYNVPDDTDIKPALGMRVLVPIGKRKIQTGILLREHNGRLSEQIEIKDIECFLDERPVVNEQQLRLWQWMSDYYMCSIGEVMKAALPAAFRLESETHVSLNPDFVSEIPLSDIRQRIFDALSDGKDKTVEELSRQLGVTTILPHLRKLQEDGALFMGERVEEKYRQKEETWICLSDEYRQNETGLRLVLNALEKAKKQQQLLLFFLDIADVCQSVRKEDLLTLSGFSASILKALTDKGILRQELREKPIATRSVEPMEAKVLNEAQQKAREEIVGQWKEKDVVLLHGVTGSGKTEIYIQLILDTIKKGKQVLYLVPEIALTTQLTERLGAVFGSDLGVYHSKISDSERAQIYSNLSEHNGYKVLLGVRSSLFLPFNNLGLIIMDEEHDTSYKQQEPAPRYHARSAAIVLAGMFSAKVLLGTATPAIESYYNALNGKYGLVGLIQRHGDVLMPKIRIIDIKKQYHKKEMQGHFSDPLVKKIADEIAKKKQVIVFQNRRGYAPWIECRQCAYVPKCVNCDVSMTLHKRQNILVCHYCGYTIPIPQVCPSCGQPALNDYGVGTEKIEDELHTLFPQAVLARMDLDTTVRKNAHQRLIDDFASHKTNILVGTQMVTKGLDFDDVSTVVVLNADNLMNQPDFRSYEKAFQMLEQVSGRAGRKHEQGEVLIQTSNADSDLLQYVSKHDYEAMYGSQIREREDFKYPPFYRLMIVVVKHRDITKIDAVAADLQQRMHRVFTRRCSGVVKPVISKKQNMYIRQILLKIETTAPYSAAKRLLSEQISFTKQTAIGKSAVIFVDVDPLY